MSASRSGVRATIDYIFAEASLIPHLINSHQFFLRSGCTDHTILILGLLLAQADLRSGCWQFNPILLNDTDFCSLLDASALGLFTTFEIYAFCNVDHSIMQATQIGEDNQQSVWE